MRSPAVEDYLRIIYELSQADGRVSTSQIAEALDVRPASVTGMIQKLATADPPLLEYHKHQGVQLTEAGRQAALGILRNHRLLEAFLQEVMGYSWDEVHAEADRLEHAISKEFGQRIDAMLGHPSRDPHGDPIPDAELQMPASSPTRMNELREGQKAVVQRVDNEDPRLLRYLGELGLRPGARLAVTGYSPFDENLHVRVAGLAEPVVLGKVVTSQITVVVLEE